MEKFANILANVNSYMCRKKSTESRVLSFGLLAQSIQAYTNVETEKRPFQRKSKQTFNIELASCSL